MANYWAVQKAVFQVLSGDTVLPTLGFNGVAVGLYDFVPQNTEPPYVQIGEMISEIPGDYYNQPITNQIWQIHIWSKQPGMSEAKQIMDRVDALLHNVSLPLAGKEITCRRELAQVLRDPDGETQHGILRYRIRSAV